VKKILKFKLQKIMTQKIIIKWKYVQLLARNSLCFTPKPKHVPCNLSSWKTQNEWTHNLNHIKVQFKTKQPTLFPKQSVLRTSVSAGVAPHTLLTWTPHVGVAQPHVATALTYDKISLCPNVQMCGPHTGSWRCAVKDFCPCGEYSCDCLVA
jgi:hypothetical protein